MAIKHPFTSNVTDIGGPTYVQPTHWNSGHNAPRYPLAEWSFGATLASWVVPSTAGATGYEFYDNTNARRQTVDFTYVDSLTLAVGVASALTGASCTARLQYAASGFLGSWYSFDATGGSAPFVSLASDNNASIYLLASQGQRFSASVVVSAAAKALPQPLTVRIAGYGGSGTYSGIGYINIFGL